MTQSDQPLLNAYRRQLELLRTYLELAEATTDILAKNDLLALEHMVGKTGHLIDELSELRTILRGNSGEESEIELVALTADLQEIAIETRVANLRNSTLIDNGLQFTQAALNAICPPSTYDPTRTSSQLSPKSLISVEC